MKPGKTVMDIAREQYRLEIIRLIEGNELFKDNLYITMSNMVS
jgi:hypothetical protein